MKLAGLLILMSSVAISAAELPILLNDTPNGDLISLYAERGAFCEEFDNPSMGGKRVVYHYRKSHPRPDLADKSVEGCYMIQGEIVLMVFADGDKGRAPLKTFHLQGAGPHDT